MPEVSNQSPDLQEKVARNLSRAGRRRRQRRLAAGIAPILGLATIGHADDIVTLTRGDVLRGTVTADRDIVVLHHPLLGDLTLPRDAIRSIVHDPETGPPDPPPEVPAPTMPPDRGPTVALTPNRSGPGAPDVVRRADSGAAAPAAAPDVTWSTRLEFGTNATRGTTDGVDLRLGVETTRDGLDTTTRLDASYTLSMRDGDRSANRFTSGVFLDRPAAAGSWSVFSEGRYDYDEFTTWAHRLTGGAGVGYQVWRIIESTDDGPDLTRVAVDVRGGLGASRAFGPAGGTIEPEAIVGANLQWRPTARQAITAGSTVYPNLREGDAYRVVSSVDWTVRLDEAAGTSVKLGLNHEFESATDAAATVRSDVMIYGALVIDF